MVVVGVAEATAVAVAAVEVTVIKVIAAKVVAIDDRSAMGDVRVVVIDH